MTGEGIFRSKSLCLLAEDELMLGSLLDPPSRVLSYKRFLVLVMTWPRHPPFTHPYFNRKASSSRQGHHKVCVGTWGTAEAVMTMQGSQLCDHIVLRSELQVMLTSRQELGPLEVCWDFVETIPSHPGLCIAPNISPSPEMWESPPVTSIVLFCFSCDFLVQQTTLIVSYIVQILQNFSFNAKSQDCIRGCCAVKELLVFNLLYMFLQ